MMTARIVTPWIGTGFPGADDLPPDDYRPAVADDYAVTLADVTAQPSGNITPDPNTLIVEVICTDDVLAAIDADDTYIILTSDEL